MRSIANNLNKDKEIIFQWYEWRCEKCNTTFKSEYFINIISQPICNICNKEMKCLGLQEYTKKMEREYLKQLAWRKLLKHWEKKGKNKNLVIQEKIISVVDVDINNKSLEILEIIKEGI